MDTLDKKSLNQLIEHNEENQNQEVLRVTMLAPMQESGSKVQQNEIQWKNVIRNAKEQLAQAGLEDDIMDQYLSEAESKIGDSQFWQHQSKGLAYFSDGNESHFFALNKSMEPTAKVAKEFMIGPTIDAVSESSISFLLACSPKRVRLLKIEGENVEDLHPDCLPDNLRDALNIDEYVSALQHHTTSSPKHSGSSPNNSGGSAAVFHGHGGSDLDVKKQDELLQYFHRLNDGLEQYFESQERPLIFAGVEYLFPIFKEACSYKNLLGEIIHGNPDELTAEQLRDKAQPILNKIQNTVVAQAIDELQEKLHTDWASNNLEEVQKAAVMGQVATLFVGPEADLSQSNLTITQTVKHGGTVHVLSEDSPTTDNSERINIAALFRTPAGSFLQSV